MYIFILFICYNILWLRWKPLYNNIPFRIIA